MTRFPSQLRTLARSQRGLTIIEIVVSIVIMAIALVGISVAISSGIRRSSDTLLETRAVALAQSYLDEILGKRFDENSNPRGIPPCRTDCTDAALLGPEDGLEGRFDDDEDSRELFDDVDDYHGLDEGLGQATPLQDAEGNERVGYANFRISVSVRYLDLTVAGVEESLGVDWEEVEPTDLDNEQDAKLITVTVYHSDNSGGWPFSVYKANF